MATYNIHYMSKLMRLVIDNLSCFALSYGLRSCSCFHHFGEFGYHFTAPTNQAATPVRTPISLAKPSLGNGVPPNKSLVWMRPPSYPSLPLECVCKAFFHHPACMLKIMLVVHDTPYPRRTRLSTSPHSVNSSCRTLT